MSYRDNFSFNPKKFKALLLYVSSKLESESNTGFKSGAIRLNKVLFYSDFISFMNYGKPITGAKYIRKPLGPVSSEMEPMKRELFKEEKAVERDEPSLTSRYHTRRFIPLKTVMNLDEFFSAHEIALVDDIIEETKDSPAYDLSRDSHELQPWKVIPHDGEEIPYSTVTIPPEPLPLSREEMEYGKKLASTISI